MQKFKKCIICVNYIKNNDRKSNSKSLKNKKAYKLDGGRWDPGSDMSYNSPGSQEMWEEGRNVD